MAFYKEKTQSALAVLDAERETIRPESYAIGVATIKANDFLAYAQDVQTALGKARNFYWTYHGSQKLVRAAYAENRPVAEVAAELLDLRKQEIARQRQATRELNRRMGWT
ncbi:hypothetical protein [Acidocella sp.]|uniref:hypothetical protein n=1 Tax=Acidocella sp. TaxID=50710 RepID=UPI003D030D57